MNNRAIVLLLVVVIIAGSFFYYQKHTHTSTLNLPGGKDISVTTHD